MSTSSATTSRSWWLWSDWCQAVGRSPEQVASDAVERVRAQMRVGPRYLADVLATARDRGPVGAEAPEPWDAIEGALDPLDSCSGRCAVSGWTAGYRTPGCLAAGAHPRAETHPRLAVRIRPGDLMGG